MKKQYIVYPGFIHSRNDGDLHYISFGRLMRLYNVHPHECINASVKGILNGMDITDKIQLFPDYSGKYELPTKPTNLTVSGSCIDTSARL